MCLVRLPQNRKAIPKQLHFAFYRTYGAQSTHNTRGGKLRKTCTSEGWESRKTRASACIPNTATLTRTTTSTILTTMARGRIRHEAKRTTKVTTMARGRVRREAAIRHEATSTTKATITSWTTTKSPPLPPKPIVKVSSNFPGHHGLQRSHQPVAVAAQGRGPGSRRRGLPKMGRARVAAMSRPLLVRPSSHAKER